MMNEFELHLDPLDVQAIAEDALRQDYIERLERENEMMADQRFWLGVLAFVETIGIIGGLVWLAVRG
jgi:hypothetical protein